MSCSGVPKTLFPACTVSSSAASYTQKGGLTSTRRDSSPSRVLWKPALQVHRKLREVEGNGQGLLIFLAESDACVGKMEFASTCRIIPGANFSRVHPSLPQARAEWVLHAPQKKQIWAFQGRERKQRPRFDFLPVCGGVRGSLLQP